MSDKKISQLTALTGANVAADDVLAIVDTNATETKKIRADELFKSLSAGTALLPAIAPAADQNTGIFFPAADTIAFSEGGVESMRIDSSGNLGITWSDDRKVWMPLNDNYRLGIRFDSGTAITQIFATTTLGDVGGAITFSTRAAVGSSATDYGTERMRINASGNVGIGTTSPTSPLHVVANNASTAVSIQNLNTTSGYGLSIESEGTSATRYALILRNLAGTVNYGGVSTTTGQVGFWGLGAAPTGTLGSRLTVNGGASIGSSYTAIAAPTNGAIIQGNVGIGTSSPAAILHTVTANEPAFLESTGLNKRLIIQETNDGNSSVGIQIRKKHSTLHPTNHWYGDIAFLGWDGSTFIRSALIESVATGTPAAGQMPGDLRFATNSGTTTQTERMRITSTGNVGIGTSSPTNRLSVSGNTNITGNLQANYNHNLTAFAEIASGVNQTITITLPNDTTPFTLNVTVATMGFGGSYHGRYMFMAGGSIGNGFGITDVVAPTNVAGGVVIGGAGTSGNTITVLLTANVGGRALVTISCSTYSTAPSVAIA